jgi:hypothetical protein
VLPAALYGLHDETIYWTGRRRPAMTPPAFVEFRAQYFSSPDRKILNTEWTGWAIDIGKAVSQHIGYVGQHSRG